MKKQNLENKKIYKLNKSVKTLRERETTRNRNRVVEGAMELEI